MDLTAWPQLELVEQILEGNRNPVWRGDLDGQTVSVRQSRRSEASLLWELELLNYLDSLGFRVPLPVLTATGESHNNGIVVQQWLTGEPPTTEAHWMLVAAELERLHEATTGYAQRPDCCVVTQLKDVRRSVDADLDAMPRREREQVLEVFRTVAKVPTAVIHGDPHSSNIRIEAGTTGTPGTVGLLDWDESRVDLIWHDFSDLGTTVLPPHQDHAAKRLSNAWEAVNGWVCEPRYARRRLAQIDPRE